MGASVTIKRSTTIGGRKSSVSLEEAFWYALKEIAARRKMTIAQLIDEIKLGMQGTNLSSAIRVFVLLESARSKHPPAH